MPACCCSPIKLSVVGHGGEAPSRVRAGFPASAAGIVACSCFSAQRCGAYAPAWRVGIQFQQPAFLALVAVTLFALNGGLFEIRLPGAVSDAAVNASGHGGGGIRGHFMSGVFATLLATPCTAPFLGTAVGFALSRGAIEIYAVFLALGIGLALPWIAVAAFPLLVNRLPKPGPWMLTLKRILSIALIGTALWLLSVLWFQIGGPATIMIALLMVAIVFTVWQYRHLSERARFATWVVIGLLTAILMVGADGFTLLDEIGSSRLKTILAQIRSTATDAGTRRQHCTGRCDSGLRLTCQVNKSLVLDHGKVAELLGVGIVSP